MPILKVNATGYFWNDNNNKVIDEQDEGRAGAHMGMWRCGLRERKRVTFSTNFNTIIPHIMQ